VIQPNDISNKRIGFSVLNWGFGHVSRCIPIMINLIQQKNELIIFCNTNQKDLLQQYLNNVHYVNHEGYPFNFKGKGNFKRDLLTSVPNLLKYFYRENKLLYSYVDEYTLDYIISDQRYGFYSKKRPSIFITHQMKLPVKGLFKIGNLINRYLISRFDSIWIVDDENERYAGALSENFSGNRAVYIGIQSRFDNLPKKAIKSKKGLLVVNGPKEYAEQLIHLHTNAISEAKIDCVVGPDYVQAILDENELTVVFIANDDMAKIDRLFMTANHIFGFFGYSTLMDCITLNVTFSLLPTPGQDEQFYLAHRHKKSL